MRQRKNDIANAAPNTCIWLSQNPQYLEWYNHRNGLLWIKGHPGVGKSTVMKYVSEAERSCGNAVLASFFFYGGGNSIQKSTLGLFRSLLHQILQQVPPQLEQFTRIFKHRCETEGSFESKWSWHERELREFFASAISKEAKTREIRIFIDALDEAGEGTATALIDFFQGVADSLSICFSCRYYPLISLEDGLEICVGGKNAEDIETFVNQKLDKGYYKPVRDQVIKKSAGNFQWVKLVVSRVLYLYRRGQPLRAIQMEIQQIPQELSDLYEELLEGIVEDDMQESLRLFQWIYFGLRPLSLTELRFAIAVDINPESRSIAQCQQNEYYIETDEAMEERVRDLSKGLAEVVQHEQYRIVQFIHQTVIDFLPRRGLQLLSQGGTTTDALAGRSHFQLSKTCLRYLGMDEVRRAITQNDMRLTTKFPFLGYSTLYWIRHATKCEEEGFCPSDVFLHCDSSSLLECWLHANHVFDSKAVRHFTWPITIVHIASSYNLASTLNAILSQGFKADSKDGSGRTPLSCAVQSGHEAIVELLLKRVDVNANSKNTQGRTPFSWAAAGGNQAILKLLMRKEDISVDTQDRHRRTPLFYAAYQGHEAIARLLLERNDVEADSKDSKGRTPLSYVAERRYEAIVRLLLERNDVEADSKDPQGRTPLSYTAGPRPLSYAAYQGHEAIVRLLLERNDVEADSKDPQGRTPLSYTAGPRPLSYAAYQGHEAIARLLLERNDVEADSKDSQGRTTLSYAAEGGDEAIVELLLERNDVEINSEDIFRRTPLSFAAKEGHEGVVQLLLKRDNTKASSKDNKGKTALDYAVGGGQLRYAVRGKYEATIRLLEQHQQTN